MPPRQPTRRWAALAITGDRAIHSEARQQTAADRLSSRAAGAARVPGQRRPDDRLKVGQASAPAEKLGREARIGDERRRVAGPPRDLAARNRAAADRLGRPNHLADRVAAAGAEVQRRAFAARRRDARARADAPRRDPGHGCSRGSPSRPGSGNRFRRSRYGGRCPSAVCRTSGIEMGLRIVQLADLAVGIGAGGVEVAQRDRAQAIGLAVPVERPLDRELGLAVGVDRQLRGGLADRHAGRIAVSRASRGKDDPVDPGLAHRIEQREGADEIVAVIQRRIGDRLADIGVGCEMHDRRRPMLVERCGESRRSARSPSTSGPQRTASRWPRERLS